MGVVQVPLPEDLKSLIDRRIAEGHAASEAEFLAEAVRMYSDHLDAEDEVTRMVGRADADMAAGRYVTVATAEDSQACHEAAMRRLRTRLANDAPGG